MGAFRVQQVRLAVESATTLYYTTYYSQTNQTKMLLLSFPGKDLHKKTISTTSESCVTSTHVIVEYIIIAADGVQSSFARQMN